MNNNAVGVAFIVIAVVLGLIGHKESQPTGIEGFATGMGEFAAAVDSSKRDQIRRDLRELDAERYKRGLPFWIIGGIFVVAGIAFLARNGQGREMHP